MRRSNTFAARATLALVLCTLAACDGPTATQSGFVGEGDLTFLRLHADAPAPRDSVVSFWAVRGEERSASIRLEGDDRKYLEFRVPADALLRYPNGRYFAAGDSVQITVRLVDAQQFLYQLEPAGLRFNPAQPAELSIWYHWVDRDYNGDGRIDEEDERIYESFGWWRQERVGDPWHAEPTVRDHERRECTTFIRGFTRYAVASN